MLAAVGSLFAALQVAWGVYAAELRRSRDDCCRKAEAHEKGNAEALAAFRRREEEDAAWRRQQERGGARAGGAP